MLRMIVPAGEYWFEDKQEFLYTKESLLILEHSLAAIAKWESKWKKPFLDTGGVMKSEKPDKSPEEFYDYIRCMTINEPEDNRCYRSLTQVQIAAIAAYIQDSATATTFRKNEQRSFSSQKITAEVVYYWMTSLNIPFECDKWNFNRLLTLIRVCSLKSQKPKKRPMREVVSERKALNEQRRAKYNTKG